MATSLKILSSQKSFSCHIHRFSHVSTSLSNLTATFSLIVPPTPNSNLLYFLSGLTCTDLNFIQKAHATPYCLKYNIAIVVPDTSPRGAGAPREDDSYDFGTGAGFWLNATENGFQAYRMEDYLIKELPGVVEEAVKMVGASVNVGRRGVLGHSMGGMGALNMMLRHEGFFTSVSAFSPISNPSAVPWGKKCLTGYLGTDEKLWHDFDPCMLLRKRGRPISSRILVDVGSDDEFEQQLRVQELKAACDEVGQQLQLNVAEGYDHSYFFVQTFLEKHIRFHSEQLGTQK